MRSRRQCYTRALFGVLATLLPLAFLILPQRPALAADIAATSPAPAAKFVEIPISADNLRQLRHGGFVLYMRHGYTDNTRPDRTPAVDLADCSTQRPLTEEGRQLAARVGESIRKARIPFADVHVSPLCRVKETAAAALPGQRVTVDENLLYVANLTQAQKAPIIANTRRLLSAPVAAGSNRMVIAHAPNLMDLIGYFPREGTVVVFRPLGDAGFEYVGSIPPALWSELPH